MLEQVGRLQVCVRDRLGVLNQPTGNCMVEVGPLALHLQVCRGEQPHRLAPARAPLLAPGYPPLRRRERPLGLAIPAGVKDALTTGRGRSPLDVVAHHWTW
jgi:hypothetical protein